MKIVIFISAIIVVIFIAIIFKKRNKKNVDNSPKGHGLSMYGKDGVKNSHLKDKE